MHKGLLFISFLSLLSSDLLWSQEKEFSSLVILNHAGTKVGILPGAGGRIVYLSHEGSPNIFKSNQELWDQEKNPIPIPSFNPQWKAYNGHIVWAGPQNKWWTEQDENLKGKNSRADWPPDPWLIYGSYEVLEHNKKLIRMIGPSSKLTGLRLVKYIRIEDDGSVYFEVEGTNTRRTPVSWDLWLNTRLDGFNLTYVPVESPGKVKISGGNDEKQDTMNYAFCRNFFYYLPKAPDDNEQQRYAKAFLNPSQNWMASFSDNHCLIIQFELYPPEKTHSDHAIVEIDNSVSSGDALIEMEYHSPYKTLQPGESMKAWERWIIYDYKRKKNPTKHIRFLKRKSRDFVSDEFNME